MFQPVSNQVDFPAQERSVLEFWTRTNAFENLRALRKDAPQRWSFVDGPITANNPMGVHHAWGRTYKDLWCRYHAMKGAELRKERPKAIARSIADICIKPTSEKASYLADLILLDSANNRAVIVLGRSSA